MKTLTTRLKWMILVSVSLLAVLSNGALAGAASAIGSFEVMGYIQPPVFVGGDYNTNQNWANIAAAKIDVVTVAQLAAGNYTKAANETGIANSYANNVKLLITDSNISEKQVYTVADKTALQNALKPYLNDARVKGFYLKDEPQSWELEGYANAYKTIKEMDPNWDVYVNLVPSIAELSRIKAPPGKLFFSNSGAQGSGSYVTPAHSLGQTITIPDGVTYLDGIDFKIDPQQWSPDEKLALRMWDSPQKKVLLGDTSLAGSGSSNGGDYYPYFTLHQKVKPGATYYLEMTHEGGGDNSVGWVVHSDDKTDTYSGGQAYDNLSPQSYDFFFRLYTSRTHNGTEWENYLDDWIEYSGTDYVLYDYYPYLFPDTAYFHDAEIIRARALAHDVKSGAFIQSIDNDSNHVVTMDMMRWNVYTLLPYGFKQMAWFYYWNPWGPGSTCSCAVDYDGTVLPRYSQMQTLNTEMRNLGNTLKDLTSTNVYHTGATLPQGTTKVPAKFWIQPQDESSPSVIGTFANPSGRKYVMLTNRDYVNANTMTFHFKPKLHSLTEISKSTGLEVPVPGYNARTGDLTIAFDKGEGKLFALPEDD